MYLATFLETFGTVRETPTVVTLWVVTLDRLPEPTESTGFNQNTDTTT